MMRRNVSFYDNILRCCNKFGFERLLNLALSKRKHVVNHYSEHPIEFKSLTFSGRCRKTRIIDTIEDLVQRLIRS